MDHDLKQNMKHWGETRIKLYMGWCVLCISTAENRPGAETTAVAGFLARTRLSRVIWTSLLLYFFKLSMLTMTAVRQFRAAHSPLDQRRFSPPPCA